MTDTASPTKSAGRFGGLAVYCERRSIAMLLLGFAAGLPNLLIFDTLSAWLRDSVRCTSPLPSGSDPEAQELGEEVGRRLLAAGATEILGR